jgi:hypothetical protein
MANHLEGGKVFPSSRYLMDSTNLGKTTIAKALRELNEAGVFQSKQKGYGTSTVYHLSLPGMHKLRCLVLSKGQWEVVEHINKYLVQPISFSPVGSPLLRANEDKNVFLVLEYFATSLDRDCAEAGEAPEGIWENGERFMTIMYPKIRAEFVERNPGVICDTPPSATARKMENISGYIPTDALTSQTRKAFGDEEPELDLDSQVRKAFEEVPE